MKVLANTTIITVIVLNFKTHILYNERYYIANCYTYS